MNNNIELFYPHRSVILPVSEAIDLLKAAPFGVELTFIDPRTNNLVQKLFPFFYELYEPSSQKSHFFLSEWDGLYISIPADLDWYIEGQKNIAIQVQPVFNELRYLSAGKFHTKSVHMEVSTNIRVGTTFDIQFLTLLKRSGHERFVESNAPSNT